MKAKISYCVLVFLFGVLNIQASDIHILASKGDTQAAQELLENHPTEISAVDSKGSTPLHLACRRGHPEMIELLLSKGADPNARNSKKETPLHGLVSSPGDNPALIEILLSRGAPIEAKDSNSETPLFQACSLGKAKSARLLVEKGAYVNMRRGKYPGWTPMYAAAVGAVNPDYTDQQRAGFVAIIEMLLQNGADFRAQCGPRQETAYDYIAVAADGGKRNDSVGAQNFLAKFMGGCTP
jgi:hypothetical protein